LIGARSDGDKDRLSSTRGILLVAGVEFAASAIGGVAAASAEGDLRRLMLKHYVH
jgi:hypothetical protein